jgi:hypothetical protein
VREMKRVREMKAYIESRVKSADVVFVPILFYGIMVLVIIFLLGTEFAL